MLAALAWRPSQIVLRVFIPFVESAGLVYRMGKCVARQWCNEIVRIFNAGCLQDFIYNA